MEELKVYGRDPRFADPIFTKEAGSRNLFCPETQKLTCRRQGIETLTKHAFNSPSNTTSRNAMRCLANAMLIKPNTRQSFVDLGYEAKACNKLKNDNRDDEFLVSRIIFLTTYGTKIDLRALVDQHGLAETIVHNLSRHAKLAAAAEKPSKESADPMEDMALAETLKLLFNIAHFCPERVASFTGMVPHMVTILLKRDPPTNNPLDPPLGPLINALTILEQMGVNNKDVTTSLYPATEPNSVAEKLIQLLDLSMSTYKGNELEQTVSPLVGVVRLIYEGAPASVRQFIQGKLLPTEEDRQEVLGRSHALSSKLLQNSTNPVTPQLREAISHLLFEMSDKDAFKFVENVGYGFASGFLFQNNLPVPANATAAYGTGEVAGTTAGAGRPVNPVTGQFLDSERFPDLPEMTQEEKEREAERLFVLFERYGRPDPACQAVC